MKILIRSTTLDGEPIPGSGDKSAGQRICTGRRPARRARAMDGPSETLQAADCLEVVELMRGQTPFTASRAPRDYMIEVLSLSLIHI